MDVKWLKLYYIVIKFKENDSFFDFKFIFLLFCKNLVIEINWFLFVGVVL